MNDFRNDTRNKILQHPLFIEHYNKIAQDEKNRPFCRHDISHFLDVARIAMIINIKENYAIAETLIYAAGLLHDIGRHKQYHEGIDHAQASAKIAKKILIDCSFSDKDIDIITDAISTHRTMAIANEGSLRGLIYRADKMSRNCFFCEAADKCNWPQEKKRTTIIY